MTQQSGLPSLYHLQFMCKRKMQMNMKAMPLIKFSKPAKYQHQIKTYRFIQNLKST
jgi:hypothetical protein